MLFAVLSLALAGGLDPSSTAPAQAPQTRGGVSVSGRLLAEDRAHLVSGTVVLRRQSGGNVAEQAGEATVRPDGTFTFREVPAGDYVLRARGRSATDGASLFATFVLSVRARAVENIELILKPGAMIQGEAVVERRHGSPLPAPRTLRIRAPLPDGSSFGDSNGAPIGPDGAFTMDAIAPGTHVLMVQGLVFPWRIVEARIQGQDAVERAFDLDAGQQVRGVRVVLADVGAGVAGTVAAPAGVSLSDVLVVAFPADPLRRALPLRFVRAGRPSSDGAYRIVDLAPGTYRVAALVGVTEQDALDPDTLERWMPASTPITLAETIVADLPLNVARGTSGSRVR